jgi:hypothetical protein
MWLVNRFKFVVSVHQPTLHATCDTQENDTYCTSVVPSVDVLPCGSKAVQLTFTFTPKCQGKYCINELRKVYWGLIPASLNLRSNELLFTSVGDFPRMSFSVSGLPETVYQDSCHKFAVVVKNTGLVPIRAFRIVYDHPQAVIFQGRSCKMDKKWRIVLVNEPLDVDHVTEVPFIFKAPEDFQVTLHFMIDVRGKRAAFHMQCVRTVCAIEVNVKPFGVATEVNIRAKIDDVEVIGIMNRAGKMVKILRDLITLGSGEAAPILVYPDQTNSEISDEEKGIEEWRMRGLSDRCFALLYRIGSASLYSQKQLIIKGAVMEERFKVKLPFSIEGKVGTTGICHIEMGEPKQPMYLEPGAFVLCGGSKEGIKGVRWIEKVRVLLSEWNDYRGQWSFSILASGIYELPWIKVSLCQDFKNPTTIPLKKRVVVLVC